MKDETTQRISLLADVCPAICRYDQEDCTRGLICIPGERCYQQPGGYERGTVSVDTEFEKRYPVIGEDYDFLGEIRGQQGITQPDASKNVIKIRRPSTKVRKIELPLFATMYQRASHTTYSFENT